MSYSQKYKTPYHLFAENCELLSKNNAIWEQKTQRSISFANLLTKVHEYEKKLSNYQLAKGSKVIVAFKPSIDFVACIFSLFKRQLIPIFLDSGLPLKTLLNSITHINANAIICEKKTYLFSRIKKTPFKSINYFLSPKLTPYKEKKTKTPPETLENSIAAIVFTSGSTGVAKGVLYTHEMFLTQIEIIQKKYNITRDDQDMSIFPLFSLFALCMQASTVILDIDFARLLKNPVNKIINLMNKKKITVSFGSPTMWNKISDYCINHKEQISSIRTIIMAGCAVQIKLLKKIYENQLIHKSGNIFITYGATESLPVTSIEGREVIKYAEQKSIQGHGTCIGKAISSINDIAITKYEEIENHDFNKKEILSYNNIGEIIISGPIVSPQYYGLDKKGKVFQDKKKLWHYIGDMVYIDQNKYYWIGGRKEDIFFYQEQAYYPILIENIFNAHHKVFRSALIQINEKPIIIIELNDKCDYQAWINIKQELLALGALYAISQSITEFHFYKKFPVDIRHNAKIKRDILRQIFRKKLR